MLQNLAADFAPELVLRSLPDSTNLDAAVTRVRSFIQSLPKANKYDSVPTGAFTGRRQQQRVYAAMQQIVTSDQQVSTWERCCCANCA